MKMLSKQHVILLHEQLIDETGGTKGLRDDGLLESALSAPFARFAETEAYPSIQQKAARLCFSLVMNHPFIDGNKRIGAHAMLVFLMLNGIELAFTQDDFSGTILKLAAGEIDYNGLLKWLLIHER
ncbi:type II toxin-antitoxin system death-on-curing family toxin [Eubacteriales bacterium OttesenSCG-928-N13]|nr:type II toxin-antitoxin system death-on-curing family toxin [Eubacteriales bacterium OttesenSCG-928-N13]